MKQFRILTRIVAKEKPNRETGGKWITPKRRWVVQQKGWFFWSDATHYYIQGHHVKITEGAEFKSLNEAEEQVEYLTRLYKPDTVVKEYDIFDVVKQERKEIVQ